MSYILGALRKAEQDSKRKSEPEKDSWNAADWTEPAPPENNNIATKFILGLLGALSIVVLAMLLMILRPSSEAETATEQQRSQQLEEVAEFAEPVEPQQINSQLIAADSATEESSASFSSSAGIASVDEEIELPVVTGHLYFAADESLSRLFGDEGSYRVGHQFENGLVLISISQTQAVFEKDRERFEMRLSN